MRHHWLALILGAFAGCVEPRDDTTSGAAPLAECGPGEDGFEHVELSAAPAALPGGGLDLAPPSTTRSAGEACACADPRCLAGWLEDQLGCGVCAHVRCGDVMTGACVRCDPPAGDDPWCLLPPGPGLAL